MCFPDNALFQEQAKCSFLVAFYWSDDLESQLEQDLCLLSPLQRKVVLSAPGLLHVCLYLTCSHFGGSVLFIIRIFFFLMHTI